MVSVYTSRPGVSRLRKKFNKCIALLANTFYDEYSMRVYAGVTQAIRKRGAGLLCFIGGSIANPYFDNTAKNAVYQLAHSNLIDGVLSLSASIGSYIKPRDLKQFLLSFYPVPIVSIGTDFDTVAGIIIDNQSGMRDMMTHLITCHGYRRIACIRGPEQNVDAENRFAAYKAVLQEHSIPVDPELIVNGSFHARSGFDAIVKLLDERKTKFDAVVAPNDYVALRAISTLRSRGIRVPEDIAVVGFDNIREAQSPDTFLTSVDQPAFQLGYEAVGLLFYLLEGGKAGAVKKLGSELIIRGSCGCTKHTSAFPAAFSAKTGKPLFPGKDDKQIETCIEELAVFIRSECDTSIKIGEIHDHAASLLYSLLNEMQGTAENVFVDTLEHIVDEYLPYSNHIFSWPRIISFLFANIACTKEAKPEFLLTAMIKANTLVGNKIARDTGQALSLSHIRDMELSFLKKKLSSVVSMDDLSALMRKDLPAFRIMSCALFIRERTDAAQPLYTPVILYNSGNVPVSEETDSGIASIEREVIVRTALAGFAFRPLFFHAFSYSNREIGFVCFGMEQENARSAILSAPGMESLLSEKIADELGSVVEGILLYKQVMKWADRVRGNTNETSKALARYDKLNLSEEKAARYFRELILYMETQKPFLVEALTLPLLAKGLNISRNHLSFVINKYAGVNFYDFLNTYRVEFAIRLMDEKDGDSERVFEIAYRAGFKSKSTFNKIFKKHTGLTPKEYRNKKKQPA